MRKSLERLRRKKQTSATASDVASAMAAASAGKKVEIAADAMDTSDTDKDKQRLSAKEKHRSTPEPSEDDTEDRWREALENFVEAREENGKRVAGLFEDDKRKRRFCERLLGFLRARHAEETYEGREKVKKFSDDVILLGLRAARALLCETSKIVEPLRSAEALIVYAVLSQTRARTQIGMEALACLNNALVDNPLAQAHFLGLPGARGFGALEAALQDHEYPPGMSRAANIAVDLCVGNQDADSGARLADVLRAGLRGIVNLALAMPRLSHEEYMERRAHRPPLPLPLKDNPVPDQVSDGIYVDFWHPEMSAERSALTTGFKLMYAVMLAQPQALMRVFEAARAKVKAGTEKKTPEEARSRVQRMQLDDESMPVLDRAGLLGVRVITAEPPSEKDTDPQVLAEADLLRATAVRMLGHACNIDDFSDFIHRRHGSQAFMDAVADLAARRAKLLKAMEDVGDEADSDEDEVSAFSRVSDTLRAFVNASATLVNASADARRAFQVRLYGDKAEKGLAAKVVALLDEPEGSPLQEAAKEMLLQTCGGDEDEMQQRVAKVRKGSK